MAQYQEISIDQGADFAYELRLGNTDGSVKDLTAHTVTSQLRRTVSTSDSDAISFTCVVNDPATDGTITLTLTNEQTSQLNKPRYLYDVRISWQDSDLTTYYERVVQGNAHVDLAITR